MQVPLPWERLLWQSRSLWAPHGRYVLTDFRLLSLAPGDGWEMALEDIGEVRQQRTLRDRLTGTSTLIVHSRRPRHEPVAIRHVRRGAQLAALLELMATEPPAAMDEPAVQAVLGWTPRWERGLAGRTVAAGLVLVTAAVGVAVGLRGQAASIVYPAGDAIYPDGVKRDRREIAAFMESVVLPWAKTTLGPLKGGADRISCATCHGAEAEARDYRMPAVAALPEPHVRPIGNEDMAATVDAQMRNAIYGYLAESDKQAKAAYMRDVVVPGIARLLGRPPYDFTKSYQYNRTRFAIGCYHCHMVNDPMEAPAAAIE